MFGDFGEDGEPELTPYKEQEDAFGNFDQPQKNEEQAEEGFDNFGEFEEPVQKETFDEEEIKT